MRPPSLRLAVALIACVPAGVSATTLRPPSLDALVAAAERIVVTEVVDVRARAQLPADEGLITTTVTFKAIATLKGSNRLREVLEFPGGTVGNDTLEVVGLPVFRAGDRDVLFVAEGGRPLSPLVGFAYGRLRLTREPDSGSERVASYNGRPIESIETPWSPRADGEGERRGVSLSAFSEAIRALVAAQDRAADASRTSPSQTSLRSSAGRLAIGDLGVPLDGALDNWRRAPWVGTGSATAPLASRSAGLSSANTAVGWAHGVFGWAFNPDLLAVTMRWHAPGRSVTLVRLNAGLSASSFSDLEGLLTHEWGHVLGLNHADALGEPAVAVMSTGPARADEPTAIDVAAATAAVMTASTLAFPPRAEALDFRTRLEAKYLDALRRPLDALYVDAEGAVVWVQEYLRYRLLGCSTAGAVERVIAQIRGFGVRPACADGAASAAFPPRDETMAFRRQLEAIYRDELRRGTVATAVDIEGDVVWTQEYLRHRLAGCTHQQGIEGVMAQIDGAPPRAGCASGDDPDGTTPVIENPSRLLFQSPDHSRIRAYEYGVFDLGAGSPAAIVALPPEALAIDGTDFALDLRAYPLVPRGRVVTLRVRGLWASGATEWSTPSQPLVFR